MNEKQIELMKYVQDNLETLKPTIPIVIPSYKNREGCLARRLDELSGCNVYVFVYDDDFWRYEQCSNVTYVRILEDWRSIQRKRHLINEYMLKEPGVTDYILVDDDIECGEVWTLDRVRHKNVPLRQFLGALQLAHQSLDEPTISTSAPNNMEFGHFDFDTFNFTRHQLHRIYVISNDFIRKSGIMFRDQEDISEDVLITHDLQTNGYDTVSFPWLQAKWLSRYEGKGSVASSIEKRERYTINTTRQLRDNTKFVLNSKGWFEIRYSKTANKLWSVVQPIVDSNTLSYHEKFEKIYEIVKHQKSKPAIIQPEQKYKDDDLW